MMKEMKLMKEIEKKVRVHSINSSTIDWSRYNNSVKRGVVKSVDNGIREVLSNIEDEDAMYFKDSKSIIGKYRDSNGEKWGNCKRIQTELTKQFIEEYSYIKVPNLKLSQELNEEERNNQISTYIVELQQMIREEDKKGKKGWIIDIRYVSMTSQWPLALAFIPFYKDGIIGYFKEGEREYMLKKISNDIFDSNNSVSEKYNIKANEFKLRNEIRNVAIIVGAGTGSGAEKFGITLKSLSRVNYFGETTTGNTTKSERFKLSNGGELLLTTGIYQDFQKNNYLNGIEVDKTSCKGDDIMQNISNWMEKENGK